MGSHLVPRSFTLQSISQREQTGSLVSTICQKLELTEAQRKRAEDSYKAITGHLKERFPQADVLLYPQGSMAHHTTVRPFGRLEHDLDLVCELSGFDCEITAAELYKLVHEALEFGPWKEKLKPKNRCIQIAYKGDFHLDVVPSLRCAPPVGAIRVPSRDRDDYVSSNPKGFKEYFDEVVAKQLRFEELVAFANKEARALKAEVEPLPCYPGIDLKPLQRVVQLLKAHRNHYFYNRGGFVPSSIVITLCAARVYERLADKGEVFETGLDAMYAIVSQIHRPIADPSPDPACTLCNPRNREENLVEGWKNEDWSTFVDWQKSVIEFIQQADARMPESDKHRLLKSHFGEDSANKTLVAYGERVRDLAQRKSIIATAGGGLAVTAPGKGAANKTFYGR